MGPFTLGAFDSAIHLVYFDKRFLMSTVGSGDHHQQHPILALAYYPFSSLCLDFFKPHM
jgi:hypothetical protein